MTQEDKQLLLKDLSARLPFGVIIHNEEGYEGHLNSINQTIFGIELSVNITAIRRVDFQMDTCKPYLRPMSSMTKEEAEEYEVLIDCSDYTYFKTSDKVIDWLNAHHFDYRYLIEKSLAIVAPDNMYK